MLLSPAFRPVPRRAALAGATLALALAAATAVGAQTAPAVPAAAAPRRPAAPVTAPAATAATPPAGTSASPQAATDDVVARVAGRDITAGDVRAMLAGLSPEQQAALAREPSALSQTLRLLLANELVLKEAQAKKWAEQPAVAAQLARVRDSAIAETYLQAQTVPPPSYPDEAELQKAYDANKSAFIVPRQFRIAQIFVALPAAADKAAQDSAAKKVSEIQAKLKQPKADFLTIAKDGSDLPDSPELGWIAETQIRPEIRSQLAGLADNAVGEPIKLADGWHIIKLMETKPAETRPLADVRAALIQNLRAQRTEALRRAYLARLLEQSPPAINELALQKIIAAPVAAGR